MASKTLPRTAPPNSDPRIRVWLENYYGARQELERMIQRLDRAAEKVQNANCPLRLQRAYRLDVVSRLMTEAVETIDERARKPPSRERVS